MTCILGDFLNENIHTRNISGRAIRMLRNVDCVKKWLLENDFCCVHHHFALKWFFDMYMHKSVKKVSMVENTTQSRDSKKTPKRYSDDKNSKESDNMMKKFRHA